jgi:hypothetical protein
MPEPAPTQPAAPADQVAAINPDGKAVWIPQSQVNDALSIGYELAPNPEETTANQLAAGAEGVARGLIPGAPKLEAAIAPEAGSIEEQNKRRQLFPTTEAIGQGVGGGLQMAGVAAATAGLGELALPAEAAEEVLPGAEAAQAVRDGTSMADAVDAAGATPRAASQAVDAAVAGGPESAEAAADAATTPLSSGYTQQALAGGVNSASDYVNEDELGDHQFNAEALLQSVGLGGLMGLAGEGAVNVLRDSIAPPVLERAGQAFDALKSKGGDLFFKASEALNPEAKGLMEPAWQAIKGGAEKISDGAAEQLADTINQASDALEDASKSHWGNVAGEEAEKNLADVPRARVLGPPEGEPLVPGQPAGLNQVKAGIDQEMGRIKSLFEAGDYTNRRPFNEVKRGLDAFEAAISDPESSVADLHEATLDFKRRVAASGIFDRGVTADPALNQDLVRSVWQPLKHALTDETIWGAEQAGRNAALDAAATKAINSQKQFLKDLGGSELDLASGKKETYVKPSRLRDALNGDPLRNQERLQHLGEYVDAAKDYLQELRRSAGNAGAVSPGGADLEALLESVTNQRRAAEAIAPVTNLQSKLATSQRWGFGALGISPVAGAAAHLAGAGLPGVGAVMAGAAALRAPVKAMQMFAKVSGAAAAARDAIGAGVKRFLGSAPAKAAVLGMAKNALQGRTIRDSQGAGSATFDRQAKNISALAANQEAQVEALSKNTSRLADVAPKTTLALHQTGIAALQELWSNLPRNPTPGVLKSENDAWKPSPAQLSDWNALHSAILKPQTFLDACAAGTATPQAWQSLQRVYPQWTAAVREQTVDFLGSHQDLELTTAQKLCTSMIVGTPISPTVAPDQVAFQQSLYLQNATQVPAGGAPKKAPQHGLDKIDLGERTALGGQRSRR